MKTATDHWRRNRGRCMGSIYWQFNDNWPVVSWSSMDYYGRYRRCITWQEDRVFVCVEYTYLQDGIELVRQETEIFVPVKYLALEEPNLRPLQLWDGSLELSADSFVPYCMLECIVGDCIWEDNVVAVTDSEPVWIKVQKGSYGSVGNIRLYDVYHTYS